MVVLDLAHRVEQAAATGEDSPSRWEQEPDPEEELSEEQKGLEEPLCGVPCIFYTKSWNYRLLCVTINLSLNTTFAFKLIECPACIMYNGAFVKAWVEYTQLNVIPNVHNAMQACI